MGGSDDFSNTIDLACTTVPSLSDMPASHGFNKRLFSEVAFCVCLLAILSRWEQCLEHSNAEADSQVALDSDWSTREGEWGHDLVFAVAGGGVRGIKKLHLSGIGAPGRYAFLPLISS